LRVWELTSLGIAVCDNNWPAVMDNLNSAKSLRNEPKHSQCRSSIIKPKPPRDTRRAKSARHDHAYYVEGRQIITDHEYDSFSGTYRSWKKQFSDLITRSRPPNASAARPAKSSPASNTLCRCCRSTPKIAAAIIRPRMRNRPRQTQPCAGRENTGGTSRVPMPPIRKHLGRDRVEYILDRRWTACPSAFTYRHGNSAWASRRGDGAEGDDITPISTVRRHSAGIKFEKISRAA